MAKKKEVVYVAPNSNIKSIVENKEVPPYEDGGVRYQSNSKKLLGGNEYRVIPQNRIIIHNTSSNTVEESIYTVPEGKRLIIASAIISHYGNALREDYAIEDSVPYCVFYITDGATDLVPPQRIQFYYRVSKNQVNNFQFNPALELRNGIVIGQIVSGVNPANVDSDYTFYGWLEDI